MSREIGRGCPLTKVSYDEYLQIHQVGDQALARPAKNASCKVCRDTGYLMRRDDSGYEFASPCRRGLMDRRIEIFNAANIPGRCHDTTLASFVPGHNVGLRAARVHALRYVSSFELGEPGIIFYGDSGVGKTHLMVAILRYLAIHQGISVRFVEFMHLLADLRITFDGPGNEAQVLRPLIEVPVLAIDELGKGQTSEWSLQVLDELVTRRYNASRTTLITTTFYPRPVPTGRASLSERVGERIYSRLQEMCIPQHLSGPDYRKAYRL